MTFIPWVTPPTLSILSEYEFRCVCPQFREWWLRLHLYSCSDSSYYSVTVITWLHVKPLEGWYAYKAQTQALIREYLTTFASLLHSASELETFAKYPESLNPNAFDWPCPLCSLKAALCTQPSSWLSAWLLSTCRYYPPASHKSSSTSCLCGLSHMPELNSCSSSLLPALGWRTDGWCHGFCSMSRCDCAESFSLCLSLIIIMILTDTNFRWNSWSACIVTIDF